MDTFYVILKILGALAFFIYGMKIMSEGIQKTAGSQLRNILRTMTKNRFIGVFSGFFVTALLQSSSATTVMIVSFANAGLLTLTESIGVIMGANIGTTVTAWLVAIIGKFKIANVAIPMMAIGVPLLFFNRAFLKNLGETILGFAILFLGLAALKESVPSVGADSEIIIFLAKFTDYGVFSTLLFVLIGTIMTIVIQSSSAAMALTITLMVQGVIGLEVGAALVLGENIGTTVTANIAALIGNIHAKRAARAHFIFNIIGVIWMIIFFSVFIRFVQFMWEPFQGFLVEYIPSLESKKSEEFQLSLFHTSFNIINMVLMVGLVPFIARIVTKITPSRGDDDDDYRLEYIGGSIKTPELSIIEVQKEVAKFGEVTSRMSGFTQKLLTSTESKKQGKMLKKLLKFEEITDRLEIELTEYLTRISREKMTPKISIRIRSILNVCNDLERIGDIFYQMSKSIEKKIEDKVWFNEHQRQRLLEMFDLVDQAFAEMISNLQNEHYDDVTKDRAVELENMIDNQRNLMREENTEMMATGGDYNVNSAMVYNNLFSSLERVGDHIINVTESVVGEI
ncbi:MAG: phosphate:Na+ symporter [Saprospiraceae bacterium]|jgi:phosphate:Na+ symporter